jgi:Uma2 family endonuclease
MNATPSIEPTERLWTREEYYKMADAGVFRPGERVELIGGRIVTMSPQNSLQATSFLLLCDALQRIFSAGYVVRMQLPLDLNPSSQPEPDIAVVPGSIRDYATAHPTTALLVVEVSESTLGFDRREKTSLYASAGIPEYWIVNLRNQRLEVYRDPVPMTGEPYGYSYRTSTQFVAGDTVSPLANPQGIIQVTDLLP